MRLAVLALPLLAGCATARVRVVDGEGRPVEGAAVTGIYPSFQASPARTDADGVATLSSDVHWISVSADGFEDARVDRPDRWPLEIPLRRASRDYEARVVLVRQGPLKGPALGVGDVDPRFELEFELKQVLRGTPPQRLVFAVHSPTLFLGGLEGEMRLIGEEVESRGRKTRRVRVARP